MLNLNIPTFIFVIINLTVLYLLLKKFLFKPVTAFMEKRAKSISDSIENAKRGMAEAEEIKRTYEKNMKDVRIQSEKMVNDAKNRAAKEYDIIIREAKHEAQGLILKARKDIEKERDEMVKEIKNQVTSLALAAASKVIEANMDTESNRILVDKFIDESGVA